MCYMKRVATIAKTKPTRRPPRQRRGDAADHSRVNVRDLRQNLSKYLVRVKAGEVIEVAERGEPVAMLVPLPEPSSVLDRLIAEGKAIPARSNLYDVGPPAPAQPGFSISEALEDLRSGER